MNWIDFTLGAAAGFVAFPACCLLVMMWFDISTRWEFRDIFAEDDGDEAAKEADAKGGAE